MSTWPTVRTVAKRVVAPLGPILFAVFPLLSLFAANQTDLEISVLWPPLAWSIGATLVLYGGFLALTRESTSAGVLASLVVVGFSYYGLVTDRGAGWFLALWVIAVVGALILAFRMRRHLAQVMVVLTVAAAAMAGPQSVSVLLYHVHHSAPSALDPRLWPTKLDAPVVAEGTKLPDIFVIIPDDYARADVLQKYFNYDDSAFVRALEQRGFVLSDQARSPYSDSESNIASLLNLDYLSNFADVLGKQSEDVRPVQRVIEDNRAARLLAPLGYDYVHIDTDEVTFSGGNPDISWFAPPDSFASLWLQQTVLRTVGGPLGFDQKSRDQRFRDSIGSQWSRLDELRRGDRPKFVVFHTLLPHDPYIFGAHGQPVTFPGRTEEDLASDVGRAYYRRQLQYVGQRVIQSVDRILANATTPPVIVIQADEGFQANTEPYGEATMQDIRVKGLSALYLPGHQGVGVPDPPNAVNILRFVFNQYFGTNYPMLPSKSYPEGDFPYQFEEMPVS